MTSESIAARETPGERILERQDITDWALPELTGLRKLLGPEWYRLLRGVVTNPLSVAGLIIVTVFILMAVFAPALAPPLAVAGDPYLIPRDGFGPEPQPPGTCVEAGGARPSLLVRSPLRAETTGCT